MGKLFANGKERQQTLKLLVNFVQMLSSWAENDVIFNVHCLFVCFLVDFKQNIKMVQEENSEPPHSFFYVTWPFALQMYLNVKIITDQTFDLVVWWYTVYE